MRILCIVLFFALSGCAINAKKLVGTYTGKCDGEIVKISLPENGLWQISKDTIILFQNVNINKNNIPTDTFIVKRGLHIKNKNHCLFIKE